MVFLWGLGVSIAFQKGLFDATPNIIVFLLLAVPTVLLIIAAVAHPWTRKRYYLIPAYKLMSLVFCTIGGALVGAVIWGFFVFTNPKAVPAITPKVEAHFRLMPFKPPYPDGTVIAGIRFERNTFDVRLYLRVVHARVRDLDCVVTLINTSGQLLGIIDVAQLTTFPGMTIVPVSSQSPLPHFIERTSSNEVSVPVGSSVPSGRLSRISSVWRIHCKERLEETTAEYVLMVSRPYRTKMIEGFVLRMRYTDGAGAETKEEWFFVKFDDSGKAYTPTQKEIDEMRKSEP